MTHMYVICKLNHKSNIQNLHNKILMTYILMILKIFTQMLNLIIAKKLE
jgi:hypothetical protein